MGSLRVTLEVRIEQKIAMGYSDLHIRQVLGCSLAAVVERRAYLEAVIREPETQIGHARKPPARRHRRAEGSSREVSPWRRVQPCGTHAAFQRHKDRGEEIDIDCRRGEREYHRARYLAATPIVETESEGA